MVLLSPFFQKVCPHNFVASVMEEGDGEEGGGKGTHHFGLSSQGGCVIFTLPAFSDSLFVPS